MYMKAAEYIGMNPDGAKQNGGEESVSSGGLHKCPLCGKTPILMKAWFIEEMFYYECCNVMGGFIGSKDEFSARKEWNSNR